MQAVLPAAAGDPSRQGHHAYRRISVSDRGGQQPGAQTYHGPDCPIERQMVASERGAAWILHQRLYQPLPGYHADCPERQDHMVEAKGKHLKNDDSREKIAPGKAWQNVSGSQYRYYMVFEDDVEPLPGALNIGAFLETIKEL